MQEDPPPVPREPQLGPIDPPAASPSTAPAASTPPATNGAPWERAVLENLAMATLREQRAARRWGIFFKLAALAYFTVLLLMVASIGKRGQAPEVTGPHTALINIEGVIDADGNNSADKVMTALNDAFQTASAKGIVLRINSPGGSPVQAGMIADEIRRLRKLHPDKPIHVVVEDICASGGYYIASAADNIYVDKASLVGSIGVILDSFGAVDLMNKVGIERRAFHAGANKDFLDPFLPIDEGQRKHIQQILDEVHQQFIANVRLGRGKRLKESPDLFSGLVWNGARAVDLGLADGLGSVDSVARDVIQAEDVVEYTVKENAFERLSKRLASQVGEAFAGAMLKTVAQHGGALR